MCGYFLEKDNKKTLTATFEHFPLLSLSEKELHGFQLNL